MSISFCLADKNKVGNITVNELLDIDKRLSQFSLDENHENFENNMNSCLSKFRCILVAEYGKSAKGFEVSYEESKNSLDIRIFTPSSIYDWKLAIDFILKMANFVDTNEVVDESGNVFSINEFKNYHYERDILIGIECSTNTKLGNLTMFGINRPFQFSEEMIEQLENSENKAELFSEWITKVQYIDAYDARQRLYKVDDDIIGVYTITEGTRTIIPYKPMIDLKYINQIKNQDIKEWVMSLVYIDGSEDDPDAYKMLGKMNYDKFISRLPEDAYTFIDGGSVLIEGLSQDILRQIIQ